MKNLRYAALCLTVVTALAACGDSGSDTAGNQTGGASTVDLAGESFALGTKGFTEHFILTQIAKLMLESAGADVTVRDLPSTQQVRAALESGDLDMYWEYTGTAWTNFLGHEAAETTDPQDLYEDVAAEDLAENGIKWLPAAPLDDTYGIVVRSEAAEDLNVETTSDLVRLAEESPEDLTICVDETFTDRPDNLPALERAYDFTVPRENITVSTYSLIFASVDEGDVCNFGAIYKTDGRIAALDLTVLDDDQGAFLSYLPALTMTEERYAEVGEEVLELMEPLLDALDTETITRLNGEVDVDGEFPEDVAENWLREEGYL